MSWLVARGEYPEVTETDAALMVLPPAKRSRAAGREGGIVAAAQLLAQIGIRWDTAASRAEGSTT